MLKWDFNKVAKQLYWNRTSAQVFSSKFATYFQNAFSWEHLGTAASAKNRFPQLEPLEAKSKSPLYKAITNENCDDGILIYDLVR